MSNVLCEKCGKRVVSGVEVTVLDTTICQCDIPTATQVAAQRVMTVAQERLYLDAVFHLDNALDSTKALTQVCLRYRVQLAKRRCQQALAALQELENITPI